MIFEPLNFEWKGRKVTLAPERVLRTIAAVEEVLTLGKLYDYQQAGNVPIGKVSMAFAIILRAAGLPVTDDEVYEGMFVDADAKNRILEATFMLQMLMIPPERFRQHVKDKQAKGAAAAGTTAEGSSPNSTAPSSATTG